MPAAAHLRPGEHRAEAAHDAVHAIKTHRPEIAFGRSHPPVGIVKQREAAKVIPSPCRPHLRGVPSCVIVSREPLVPDGIRGVDDLFEDGAFGGDEFHTGDWGSAFGGSRVRRSNCTAANATSFGCTTSP